MPLHKPKIYVYKCDWVYPILIYIGQYFISRGYDLFRIKEILIGLLVLQMSKIFDFSLNNWISICEIIPISFNLVEEKSKFGKNFNFEILNCFEAMLKDQVSWVEFWKCLILTCNPTNSFFAVKMLDIFQKLENWELPQYLKLILNLGRH